MKPSICQAHSPWLLLGQPWKCSHLWGGCGMWHWLLQPVWSLHQGKEMQDKASTLELQAEWGTQLWAPSLVPRACFPGAAAFPALVDPGFGGEV